MQPRAATELVTAFRGAVFGDQTGIMNDMATLRSSNKYLSSASKRAIAVWMTVATSSAIEGIHAPFKARTAASKKPAKTKKGSASRKVRDSRHAKSAR